MRLKVNNTSLALTLILLSVIQCQIAAGYRTEVEITPSPIEEPTTKKSGFFGGIKNFFRGSPTTTTTVAPIIEVTTPKSVPAPQVPTQNVPPPNAATAGQKPPPLIIPKVPLVPLGPRPDTPPSSPLAGSPQQQPQWPQAPGQAASPTAGRPVAPQQLPQQPQQPQNTAAGGAATFGGNQRPGAQPNLPPGFTPYRPARPQPSGLDLSYGGASGGRPQGGGQPGFGLAPLTSSTTTTTTTTTTTPKPAPQSPMNFDLRMGGTSPSVIPGAVSTTTTTPRSPQIKEDFPALPSPRRPSTGAKEDFPALPVPKSPTPVPTSPSSPQRPSSPSAWGGAATPSWGTPATPIKPVAPTPTPDRVSFVPHAPGSSTTVRPGFESSGNSVATDAEIEALTETLYTKETNSQLSLIRINLQGKTRSIDSTDEAPQPLLEVNPKALEPPTIAKLRLLFNNYEMDTLTNEHVTPNERLEENDFVDAVMATSVMRQAMLFLQNKGIVSPDPKTHRDLVKELWFTQYSRGSGKIGSSGFEHVFVNEVKNGTIIGLHNWVYFDEEEKAGRLNYMGYMNAIDLGTKGKVIKMRFNHNGLKKPVNTLFAGTSPELELALYTVCFKLRPDRTCPVSLGNSKFGIVTYSWRYRGKSLIGSAFPEI